MAADAIYVEDVESDTLAGLATAMETILNTTYTVVSAQNPFPPALTITRGQSKNLGGHVVLYGTLNP